MTLDFLSRTSRTWILAGAAAGGLAGLVIFLLLLDYSSAIELIQIGRVDGRSAPITLIERMQTTSFAKRVAEKAGVDPLDLAASQYGGYGHLRVRQIGDTALIEIQSKAPSPATALRIVAAAGDIAVAEDRALMGPLRALAEARVTELARQRDDAALLANAMASAFREGSSGNSLLSSLSEAQTKMRVVSDELWSVRSNTFAPVSQEADVFAEATLSRPILSHWWQAVLIGALTGAAVGFSASLRRRQLPLFLAGISQSAAGEDGRVVIDSLPLQRSS